MGAPDIIKDMDKIKKDLYGNITKDVDKIKVDLYGDNITGEQGMMKDIYGDESKNKCGLMDDYKYWKRNLKIMGWIFGVIFVSALGAGFAIIRELFMKIISLLGGSS